MTTPTAVTVAAPILFNRLRMEVVTIEACEDALNTVYALWESRGMFGTSDDDTDDLDAACAIIDDARHAVMESSKTRLGDRLAQIVLTTGALRLVREWEQRKRRAADPTPTSVRVHESNAEFCRPMLHALPDAAKVIYLDGSKR